MTQRAIVAGAAGPSSENDVKRLLVEAAACLGQLAPGHALSVRAAPAIRTPALLDAVKAWRDVPSTEGVWLILSGAVEYDEDEEEHQLQMADGVGLGVAKLARLVKRATAGWRVILLG